MNRISIIIDWLRFRTWYYLPFLRPANLILEQGVRIDLYSFMVLDAGSRIRIGKGSVLSRTVIRAEASVCDIGDGARLTGARFILRKSCLTAGAGMIIQQAMLSLNDETEFKAGDHFMMVREHYFKCGLFAQHASIRFGVNVNLRCHVVCHSSELLMGDHVFINEGTQLRCTQRMEFGSHILVSYECIIFDTNTHSIDPADRRAEMVAGFPNAARQTDEIRSKVKTAPVKIGNDVWIGTRAIILKGTTLGNAVIVGAAAVVSGLTVPDQKTVAGNPGRFQP